MKIIIKYHIEYGVDIIECNSLEEVQRKIKHMTDFERYIIQTEIKDGKIINQTLIGM